MTEGRRSEVWRDTNEVCVCAHSWRRVSHYLQRFVWQLFVRPLLQFNVYSGVEGSRVRGLSSRKVDVLDDVSGDSLPQLLLQDGLPEGRKSATRHSLSSVSCSPDKLEYIFTRVCARVRMWMRETHLSYRTAHISLLPVCFV